MNNGTNYINYANFILMVITALWSLPPLLYTIVGLMV